ADAFERDYAYCQAVPPKPARPEPRYWMGYDRGFDRPDHFRYGSRNYVAIISTLNCSASTSKYISERIRMSGVLKDYPNVDGVIAITHKAGCAMQDGGAAPEQRARPRRRSANHPHAAPHNL